jgi:hypothetical protein
MVAEYLLCQRIVAAADFAVGGYPLEDLALAYRSTSAPRGVGGYFTEGSQGFVPEAQLGVIPIDSISIF